MTDEYIKRDDAIEAVWKRIKQIGYEDNPYVLSIRQAVREIPAADAAPVKHGRWVETEEEICWHTENAVECSECGESYILDEWGYDEFKRFMNFCPNCGAKMDKEEDDESV